MSGRTKVLAGLLVALSLGALSASLYLTWSSWQTETVAGCNGEGSLDCDAVLTSHWSKWLGWPVSLFGSITYVGILAVCWPAAKHPAGKAGMPSRCSQREPPFGLLLSKQCCSTAFASIASASMSADCASLGLPCY